MENMDTSSQPLSEEDLLDMVSASHTLPHSTSPAPGGPRPDTHTSQDPEELLVQLAQKEHDLTLAAEVGKALLEKNQELSRKNEQLVDEYNQKLEVS